MASIAERVEQRSLVPVLDGVDAARARILKRAARLCAPFIRDRDRRLLAIALVSCACALAATALAPGYALLLGPVILGVPHLVFEARYLFFQHERLRRAALVAVVALQSIAVFAGIGIYTLGLACALAMAVTEGLTTTRGRVLLAASTAVQIAALVGPDWSRFALLHLHNCIALGTWLIWRRRPTRVSIAVVACVVVGVAAILAGAFDDLSLRRPASDQVFSLTHLTDAVAVGFGGAWRHRLLLFFCFTQAVHYAIWLRLIPEEARERATPRSWRASWLAFKRDSGANVARFAVIAATTVPIAALLAGAVRTRALYVTASEFHATVEVVLLCAVFAQIPRSAAYSASSCAQNRSRSR
jgi:hypothetical protein